MKRRIISLTGALLLMPILALAQDLEPFGLTVDLPEGWETTESHTPSLPDFGVYSAQSEEGGYFWIQVMNLSGEATESPLPDSLLSEGVSMFPIDHADEIAGFADGYHVVKEGLNSYFFVSTHGDRLFRFRIGIDFDKASFAEGDVAESNAQLKSIVRSIAFVE